MVRALGKEEIGMGKDMDMTGINDKPKKQKKNANIPSSATIVPKSPDGKQMPDDAQDGLNAATQRFVW